MNTMNAMNTMRTMNTMNAMSPVIFGLGGTLLDMYSKNVFHSLKYAFRKNRYYMSDQQIMMHMGYPIPLHIRSLVIDYYREAHRTYYHQEYCMKIVPIYEDYLEHHMASLVSGIDLLPGVTDAYEYLRYNDAHISLASVFSKQETRTITESLRKQGIAFDEVIYPNTVNRWDLPEPSLLIDSTIYGLTQGVGEGCQTLGISRYSCMNHLLYFCPEKTTEYMRWAKRMRVQETMRQLGVDHVIDDLNALPPLLEGIQ